MRKKLLKDYYLRSYIKSYEIYFFTFNLLNKNNILPLEYRRIGTNLLLASAMSHIIYKGSHRAHHKAGQSTSHPYGAYALKNNEMSSMDGAEIKLVPRLCDETGPVLPRKLSAEGSTHGLRGSLRQNTLKGHRHRGQTHTGVQHLLRGPTRVRNFCIITGRSRGIIKKFGISRLMFRKLADKGFIPGVRKSSW